VSGPKRPPTSAGSGAANDPSPRVRLAPPKPRSAHPGLKRWLARAWRLAWVAGAAAVVVVVFVFVFPTRTYLDQRNQINQATTRLSVLDQQNAELAAEAQKLQSPAEIERLAREQYHMVQPGEKAYVILPPPAPPTSATPAPTVHHSGGWWHTLTSWLP
jgi:cell division protein FtsL